LGDGRMVLVEGVVVPWPRGSGVRRGWLRTGPEVWSSRCDAGKRLKAGLAPAFTAFAEGRTAVVQPPVAGDGSGRGGSSRSGPARLPRVRPCCGRGRDIQLLRLQAHGPGFRWPRLAHSKANPRCGVFPLLRRLSGPMAKGQSSVIICLHEREVSRIREGIE